MPKHKKKLNTPKKDISGLNRKQLFYLAEREWKAEVLKRDKVCQTPESSACAGYLHVHHCVAERRHKNTFFEPNNGIVLCYKHHFYGAHSKTPSVSWMYRKMVMDRLGKEEFERIEKESKIIKKWSKQELLELIEKLGGMQHEQKTM